MLFELHVNVAAKASNAKTTVCFEIKKPPWVSVVRVVIACCICSEHDPCIYAARNAESQQGGPPGPGGTPRAQVEFKVQFEVSVVWVVIACCICSKQDPCIYAARNAQSQRGKIFATHKSFDGASEASDAFYQQRNTLHCGGASEASGVLLAIRSQLRGSERSEWSFFICTATAPAPAPKNQSQPQPPHRH